MAGIAGKAGKAGKSAFFIILAGKAGKSCLCKLYWLEKLEKKFMKHDVVVVVISLFLITQK